MRSTGRASAKGFNAVEEEEALANGDGAIATAGAATANGVDAGIQALAWAPELFGGAAAAGAGDSADDITPAAIAKSPTVGIRGRCPLAPTGPPVDDLARVPCPEVATPLGGPEVATLLDGGAPPPPPSPRLEAAALLAGALPGPGITAMACGRREEGGCARVASAKTAQVA